MNHWEGARPRVSGGRRGRWADGTPGGEQSRHLRPSCPCLTGLLSVGLQAVWPLCPEKVKARRAAATRLVVGRGGPRRGSPEPQSRLPRARRAQAILGLGLAQGRWGPGLWKASQRVLFSDPEDVDCTPPQHHVSAGAQAPSLPHTSILRGCPQRGLGSWGRRCVPTVTSQPSVRPSG